MKKYLFFLPLLFLGTVVSRAQSVQDNFFKSWDLTYFNPAALTQDGGLKGNLTYTQDLVGSVEANVGGQLQLHTNFGGNHGAGITMQSARSGILTGNSVGAGYAYRVRLASNQTLSAGGRFNYFKYSLNRAAVVHADGNDPILYGDMFQQSSLLISTGLLYEWGQFKLAVTAPEFLPIEGGRYARKNVSAYTDYSFLLNDWQLRPNFYFEHLAALRSWYEMGLYTSYKERVAVEVAYTSENALRAKASVSYSNFTVGYGYNAGKTSQETSASQVGHRIYVGYAFGDIFANAKKRKEQEELEKQQVETIIQSQTQLIEDYKKVLNQSEENYLKALQAQTDSLSALIDKKNAETQALLNPTGKAPAKDKNDSPKASDKPGTRVEAETAEKGYYVAMAAFDTMKRVATFMEESQRAGFSPKVMYNSQLKVYRVYLDNFKSYQEALKWRNILRKKGIKDSWIFLVK